MNAFVKAGCLAICAICTVLPAAALADGYKTITTKSAFDQTAVGKKLWYENNHFTIKPNGALTGNFGGKRLKGAWEWRDKYWCRTLTTHSKNTDCQVWETDGKNFRATRGKGSGKS